MWEKYLVTSRLRLISLYLNLVSLVLLAYPVFIIGVSLVNSLSVGEIRSEDLLKEVEENRFRMDLYHRLSVILIHVPPLRDRLEDLPLISDHFLDIYRKKYNKQETKINAEAFKKLKK